jgi:hypothetical protein
MSHLSFLEGKPDNGVWAWVWRKGRWVTALSPCPPVPLLVTIPLYYTVSPSQVVLLDANNGIHKNSS